MGCSNQSCKTPMEEKDKRMPYRNSKIPMDWCEWKRSDIMFWWLLGDVTRFKHVQTLPAAFGYKCMQLLARTPFWPEALSLYISLYFPKGFALDGHGVPQKHRTKCLKTHQWSVPEARKRSECCDCTLRRTQADQSQVEMATVTKVTNRQAGRKTKAPETTDASGSHQLVKQKSDSQTNA